MVDIQSVTAEIRRRIKKRRKNETTRQKYNGLPAAIISISKKVPQRKCPMEIHEFHYNTNGE